MSERYAKRRREHNSPDFRIRKFLNPISYWLSAHLQTIALKTNNKKCDVYVCVCTMVRIVGPSVRNFVQHLPPHALATKRHTAYNALCCWLDRPKMWQTACDCDCALWLKTTKHVYRMYNDNIQANVDDRRMFKGDRISSANVCVRECPAWCHVGVGLCLFVCPACVYEVVTNGIN